MCFRYENIGQNRAIFSYNPNEISADGGGSMQEQKEKTLRDLIQTFGEALTAFSGDHSECNW